MRADLIAALKGGADLAECRLDFLSAPPGGDDLRRIVADHPDRVIVTYRPAREGGRWYGPESQRLKALSDAMALGCLAADVEADVPSRDWPTGQVILSHHDFTGPMSDLPDWIERLAASDAAVSKVAFLADGCEDCFRAFDVIRAQTKPVIALAMGPHGTASRILAGKFGAFGTFAALDAGSESAPGQLTLSDMKDLYRWDRIGPKTALYGVIGCPIAHSMSPAVHNAAFGHLGLDACYVPLLVEPGWDNFKRFMDALLARPWLDWRGLSVTIPHKENALRYVGQARCDELGGRIGAVNTITLSPDGSLRGDNTDYSAAVGALCQAMRIAPADLASREVAILGAGGAARSIVAALRHYGAKVAIYNRTVDRGRQLAQEFGCDAGPLGDVVDAAIVVNCTPLGMHPRVDACPVRKLGPSVKVVFDTIYNPLQTRLLELARAAGCVCVSGLEMFVLQAAAQLEIWTAQQAPVDFMRQTVLRKLAEGNAK